MSNVKAALAVIKQMAPAFNADVALVLGSGMGGVVDAISEAIHINYADLPGFPRPTVEGHGGKLVLGRIGAVSVAVMQGRAHYYEHGRSDLMAEPLEVLRELGAGQLILTNAAGSLLAEATPGNLMLITDHISLFGPNPLIGYHGADRFVDMNVPYDPEIGAGLHHTAAELGVPLFEGTYAWCTGPSFETPAEIRALRVMGADAVGMSTVPENILARRLGFRVAAISNITNLAAGMSKTALSHEQTLEMAKEGSANLIRILLRYFAQAR
ncbi:purine nucleoside phosphorylase [Thalassospira profundimaris]|uniref:Purine nucleoside phosphorylase n=1 Tax=Thalassospira profundimaris TaxID=502049 RepID=A0A367XEE7_9PROT|nr:purine-nucleoside phosphorylase [Thalassospira profundimaris]RCK51171.1 purine nucleoside phosphorylase [Thalassospira profundimaris]